MSTDLTLYGNTCRAMAELYSIDEVKNIRDKAVAMQAYAQAGQGHDADHASDRVQDARRAPGWRAADRNGGAKERDTGKATVDGRAVQPRATPEALRSRHQQDAKLALAEVAALDADSSRTRSRPPASALTTT